MLKVVAPVTPTVDANVAAPVTADIPDIVDDTPVILPIFKLAYPVVLIAPAVVPVSVVIIPSNAVSASFQTRAAFTAPYGAKLLKFLFTSIPIS